MVKMKSFKEYLQEAGTGAGNKGMEMENVIIAALNGTKYTPTNKTIAKNAGKKIIKKAKLSGKAFKLTGRPDVTRKWASYFPGGKVPAGTRTPKTDIIVGKKRISLKTADAKGSDKAYIVGASKSEAQAIFYTACASSRISNKKLVKKIGKHFNKMYDHKRAEVKGDAHEVKAKLKSDIVNKGQDFRNIMLADLKDLFYNNDTFSYYYTLEGMTGMRKFGKDHDAAAQYCLIVDNTGEMVSLHDLYSSSGKKYVNRIKAQTKLQVRFGGGNPKKAEGHSTWSHTVNQYIEHLSRLTEEVDTLTEAQIWNKWVTAITKMFNKVIEWIGDSWKKLLEFFEIEPTISFNNNNIKW